MQSHAYDNYNLTLFNVIILLLRIIIVAYVAVIAPSAIYVGCGSNSGGLRLR